MCSRPPLAQGGRHTLARGRGNGGPKSDEGTEKNCCSQGIIVLCPYFVKVLEGAWLKLFSLVESRVTASLRKRKGGRGAISKDGEMSEH